MAPGQVAKGAVVGGDGARAVHQDLHQTDRRVDVHVVARGAAAVGVGADPGDAGVVAGIDLQVHRQQAEGAAVVPLQRLVDPVALQQPVVEFQLRPRARVLGQELQHALHAALVRRQAPPARLQRLGGGFGALEGLGQLGRGQLEPPYPVVPQGLDRGAGRRGGIRLGAPGAAGQGLLGLHQGGEVLEEAIGGRLAQRRVRIGELVIIGVPVVVRDREQPGGLARRRGGGVAVGLAVRQQGAQARQELGGLVLQFERERTQRRVDAPGLPCGTEGLDLRRGQKALPAPVAEGGD